MTQQEYLKSLKEALERQSVSNVSDVLNDYKEHFTHGLQNGKSESEISDKLGNPIVIAKAYETEALIQKMKDPETGFQFEMALRVIGRLMVIAPFNLILFLIPGVILFSLLIAGWSVAVALGSAGLALFGFAFKTGVLALSLWFAIGIGSSSLALLGVGVFALAMMFVVTKSIMLALINYLQWNLKFVMEK
jgi:uncharacterized membrane protein